MFLFALVYTAGTVSGMYGRGFGFLGFAMLVVALIAECVVSKGSFSGIRRIVVLLILISSAVLQQHNSDTLQWMKTVTAICSI